MFDLAAFDAEIERRNRVDNPGDDELLASAVRISGDDSKISVVGATSGTVMGALALASMVMPMFWGGATAEAMTFNGMTMEQFAVHMNMSLSDPQLIAMFEQVGMI